MQTQDQINLQLTEIFFMSRFFRDVILRMMLFLYVVSLAIGLPSRDNSVRDFADAQQEMSSYLDEN